MRVFITGASSGIGAALARAYSKWAHQGDACELGLVARRESALDELAEQLRHAGAKVSVYRADVTDLPVLRRAIQDFSSRGDVDRVIANAGMGVGDTLREGDAESVAHLMSVNVIGATNTLVPFIPILLRQNSGTLVAMSSFAGFRGLPGRAAYSASKAALTTFMDAVRVQLLGTGVHAMTICPGFIRTPMTDTLKHKLPFLLDVDHAADSMLKAIERREKTYTLPWQMNLLRHLIVNVPEWMLRRMSPPGRQPTSEQSSGRQY